MISKIISTSARTFCTTLSRRASGVSLVKKVATTDNGKTVVAWHPKENWPYQFSKPINIDGPCENQSVLKETAVKYAASAFKHKHQEIARQELMNLTYTTKHRWFPRSRDRKAKNTPQDRPYL